MYNYPSRLNRWCSMRYFSSLQCKYILHRQVLLRILGSQAWGEIDDNEHISINFGLQQDIKIPAALHSQTLYMESCISFYKLTKPKQPTWIGSWRQYYLSTATHILSRICHSVPSVSTLSGIPGKIHAKGRAKCLKITAWTLILLYTNITYPTS